MLCAGNDTALKKRMARIGVDSFLQMCFKDNFVHGDLHPGNILVKPGDKGGITFLDAGITTELSAKDRREFHHLVAVAAIR